MPDVEKLYRWLAADQRADADAILGTALKHAESDYIQRLAGVLLQRKTDRAWAALAGEYDRLSPEVRAALLAEPALVRVGVAAALRVEEPGARRGPLHLLEEHPQPHLLHLVAEALRDPTTEIKEVAGRVIRKAAEAAVAVDPWQALDDVQAAANAADRADVVRGLSEAFRTFEAHFQLDVLEACLWFSRDLGAALWSALETRRSHAAYAISEHVESWNQPRLAGFLLAALGRPAWRRTAHTLLNTWGTRAHLLAILANSEVLDDPATRASLRLIKCPRWLAAAGPGLNDVPPAARARLPRWICYLGFAPEDRHRLLASWVSLPWPDVQQAAVYALAELGTAGATRILADVARRAGPPAQYARWFVTGWSAAHAPAGPDRCRPAQIEQMETI